MKIVVIYIRVSTDEQAEKGFSLQHQEQYLRTYCKMNDYEIIMIFREDYSAKNFDRPEWSKLEEFVRKNRKRVDIVLFTRWDRFSRNQEQALRVIREFDQIGVEINSAETPLNLSIPEHKLLLSFHLSIPEIENDKNRIRTTEGMREAKKEGCWVGTAPWGYKNHRCGKKSTLIPNEKAMYVKECFELINTGLHNSESVRKLLLTKYGIRISKQSMWNMLNNVAYSGRIYIPEFKKEEEMIVLGLHDAIVSVEVFESVQRILKGRRKQPRVHNKVLDQFPLRNYLICPHCGGNMTASTSTGRHGVKHSYYHCMKPKCKGRFRSDLVNREFLAMLSDIKVTENIMKAFKHVCEDISHTNEGDRQAKFEELNKEESKCKSLIEAAQEKFLLKEISKAEYDSMKSRYEASISDIAYNKIELESLNSDFKKYITFCVEMMGQIDVFYDKATIEVRQQILVSMFEEKLIFDGKAFRTARLNEVASAIISYGNGFRGSEKRKVGKNADQSREAPPAGLEPATL